MYFGIFSPILMKLSGSVHKKNEIINILLLLASLNLSAKLPGYSGELKTDIRGAAKTLKFDISLLNSTKAFIKECNLISITALAYSV